MHCSLPGSSVHGIFPGKETGVGCYGGLLFPTPGDLPNPGMEIESPVSPALAGTFFTTRATWESPMLPLLRLLSALCTLPSLTAGLPLLHLWIPGLAKRLHMEGIKPLN